MRRRHSKSLTSLTININEINRDDPSLIKNLYAASLIDLCTNCEAVDHVIANPKIESVQTPISAKNNMHYLTPKYGGIKSITNNNNNKNHIKPGKPNRKSTFNILNRNFEKSPIFLHEKPEIEENFEEGDNGEVGEDMVEYSFQIYTENQKRKNEGRPIVLDHLRFVKKSMRSDVNAAILKRIKDKGYTNFLAYHDEKSISP